MDEDAEKIIKQVIEEADADRKEIEKEIEEKQEELSGFITPEGAATIVARKYGVVPKREEPEVQKLRIGDLSEGMSNIEIVGRITRIFEPRKFERKDGSEGKVANLLLMDETGKIRTVLWGKMANLVAEEEVQKGTAVKLEGAYVKKGQNQSLELNIGRRGEIELEPEGEKADNLPSVSDIQSEISDLDPSKDFVDVFGRVAAVTAPRKFERSDGSEGKVATLRIIDATGQVRVSLWGEKAEQVEEINQGDAVKIENASVREGWQDQTELHVNWQSRLDLTPPEEDVKDLPEFERELLKIEEIEPDMPVLDVAAKVQRTFSPNEFTRDDGSTGQVMNAILADETGTIRASFWNEMVETGRKLSPGDTIVIENASSSVGLNDRTEIRVGKRCSVKINPEDLEIREKGPSKVKMAELKEGMDSIEIIAKVIEFSEVREFSRSDGSNGKVASLTLGDKTGTGEVTLWGTKTDVLKNLDRGDVVRITNSYTVPGNYGQPEIHIGEQGEIEVKPEVEEKLPTVEKIQQKYEEEERIKIGEAEEGKQVEIRGTIVRVFERDPFFNSCPDCGRNLKEESSETLCENCGDVVEPESRVVLNMIVDDGTGNIRAVAFGSIGEKLIGKSGEELSNEISDESDVSNFFENLSLTGKEIILSGRITRDEYFDQLELRSQDLRFPNPSEEAEKILERVKT